MANYYFVGDGCEVLACEACKEYAREVCAEFELQGKTDDALSVYECDPSEIIRDDSSEEGKWIWAHPSERYVAEQSYSLPSLEECVYQRWLSALSMLHAD